MKIENPIERDLTPEEIEALERGIVEEDGWAPPPTPPEELREALLGLEAYMVRQGYDLPDRIRPNPRLGEKEVPT
jgi:hypothetical protein